MGVFMKEGVEIYRTAPMSPLKFANLFSGFTSIDYGSIYWDSFRCTNYQKDERFILIDNKMNVGYFVRRGPTACFVQ